MKIKDYTTAPGHWLLARMGKRVLRPGGRSLTQFLLSELAISPATDIVEFAPGLGFTASLALKQQPQSYVGIDTDKEVINMLKQKLHGTHIRFLTANASATVLEAESKDKVFGEAMLTMQNDSRKKEIVQEAYRILKKGGLYAVAIYIRKSVGHSLQGIDSYQRNIFGVADTLGSRYSYTQACI
jgi:ubiquinone/menaquinone biosynthesis C-methylase UbiE